jgi:GNAT superfamily N-acetyltransferase
MVADPSLAIIAESKGKVVGFALALPDINECLIHNKNGGMAGALWHLMTKKNKISTCRIIALGVIPEFQKSGIDSVLYYEIGERGANRNIFRGEASWVLEDNRDINQPAEQAGARLYKTSRIYQKALA